MCLGYIIKKENTDLNGFVRNLWDLSWSSLKHSRLSVRWLSAWAFGGVFFWQQHLFKVFVLLTEHRDCRKAESSAYISWGHFSRSQPFIRSFTLAWSKKCTSTTMIQVSLQLWPKHCTSVGGPIKVLPSSQWELLPPVKERSLEQHIQKSGLTLPREDSLTFSRSMSFDACSRRACQLISA